MWISQKNENSSRSNHSQSPPPQQTQKADNCLSFCFPKSSRILSKGHYHRLSRSGNKFFGESIGMDYFLGQSSCPKLGITVSKRFGKANQRNKFKRAVREAFRLTQHNFPKNLEINVFPRKSTAPSLLSAIKDLEMLILHVATQFSTAKSGSCN